MTRRKIISYLIMSLLGCASQPLAMQDEKDKNNITVNKSSTDVLIVGAGASGLTLSIELARRGISFRLVDRLKHPFHGSRGKGIQPRSQEVFEDLGILDRIVSVGGLYPPQREYNEEGGYKESLVVQLQDPTSEEPYHIPLLVPQFLTESVMRDRLVELGSHPQFNCELQSFEQDEDGVTAHLISIKGEEIIRARYLIGADGGRSVVRHTLNIPFSGKTLGVRAIVADVEVEGVGTEVWHRWNEGDMKTQVALCPLPGTHLFQLQGPVPLEGDVDLSSEGLTAFLSTRTNKQDIKVRSVSWASVFNMNARLAEHYHVNRVFLIGDAAHIHPPTGGQGLNTSIQDAYNLGWKLAAVLKGAPDNLLSTYEEERRPIAADMLGISTALLEQAKEGIRQRSRQLYQLDIGYPFSSLALQKTDRTEGLLAGQRAPDGLVRGAGGQSIRLFNLFKGSHWTLLGYEVDRSNIEPRFGLHIHFVGSRGDIVDDDNYFRNSYGVISGDWVLVRPDGYIGAIVSSEHIADLKIYFNKVGLGL